MHRYPHIAIIALTAAVLLPTATLAQSAISADGVIESQTGGFKFPDGTIQTTAAGGCPTLDPSDEMIQVGGVCIDKYEASIWDAPTGGSQITGAIPCNVNGQDCVGVIYARSVAGVEPRGDLTWFQAQQALANSGKRLPTNAEWQMAAAGTPDDTNCNVSTTGSVANTGAHPGCVSAWGAFDMVGNLWEWVADWGDNAVDDGTCVTFWSFAFGDDISCFGLGEGETNNHLPGALQRGGSFGSGTQAGPFAVSGNAPPSTNFGTGFRGAR